MGLLSFVRWGLFLLSGVISLDPWGFFLLSGGLVSPARGLVYFVRWLVEWEFQTGDRGGVGEPGKQLTCFI